MEKRTKKDEYKESLFDKRTYVNGETAIKPYWYLRNGVLHIRYNVDRCVKLTPSEIARLKVELTANSQDKQAILEKAWNLFTQFMGRDIIQDGIAELEKKIKELKENGCKD